MIFFPVLDMKLQEGGNSWFCAEMTETSVSNLTLFLGHTYEIIRKNSAQHP